MEKEQQLESVRGTEKSTIHSLHMLLCVWQWSDKKDEISMKSFEQLLPRFTPSSLKVYFFYGLTKERKEEWKAAFMSSCLPNRFKDWGISIQMYKIFPRWFFFSPVVCFIYFPNEIWDEFFVEFNIHKFNIRVSLSWARQARSIFAYVSAILQKSLTNKWRISECSSINVFIYMRNFVL